MGRPRRLTYDEAGAPGSAEPVRRRADGARRRVRGERCGRPRAGRRRARPAVAEYGCRVQPGPAPCGSLGTARSGRTDQCRLPPRPGARTGGGHRPDPRAGAGSADSLALPHRLRRARRRAARALASAARRRARCDPRAPQRRLRADRGAERPGSQGAAALGLRAHLRGERRQDRGARRRRRRRPPVLRRARLPDADRLPARPAPVHEQQGDRRALLRARQHDLEARGQGVRSRLVHPRHPCRRHRGRQLRYPHLDGRHDLRRRSARLHRQLQGAERAHRRPWTERQLARDRRRDRGGRRGRHGRDQSVARRAGDRPSPRPGRPCPRRGGQGRGRVRRRGRQRLRRARSRLAALARHLRRGDHGRLRRFRRRPGLRLELLVRWPDADLPATQAGCRGAGLRRHLLDPEQALQLLQRDEHGRTACGRRGRNAPPAPPHVDAGPDQVGARQHGRAGRRAPAVVGAGPGVPRGRRA